MTTRSLTLPSTRSLRDRVRAIVQPLPAHAVSSPKRGFHCGPYNNPPSLQSSFLSQNSGQFHPGMLVVIDNWFMYDYINTGHGYGDISDAGYATWLKQQQDAGVEVFVRIYRSGTTNFDSSKNANDGDVFNRMNAIYNAAGLTRFIPGNEPNNEWNGTAAAPGSNPSQAVFWDGVADFYQAVLNDYNLYVPKNAGGQPLWEVYFPERLPGDAEPQQRDQQLPQVHLACVLRCGQRGRDGAGTG